MMPSRIGTKGITVPLKNRQNYWVLALVYIVIGNTEAKGKQRFLKKSRKKLSLPPAY
jgi:hypothetical protein